MLKHYMIRGKKTIHGNDRRKEKKGREVKEKKGRGRKGQEGRGGEEGRLIFN